MRVFFFFFWILWAVYFPIHDYIRCWESRNIYALARTCSIIDQHDFNKFNYCQILCGDIRMVIKHHLYDIDTV